MYQYFKVSELFISCSQKEILECIKDNKISGLLILLMVLDSFREFVECPIIITSSYRDEEHNKRVNGSPTSQHMLGEAIDFVVPKVPMSCLEFRLKDFFKCSGLRKFVGQVIFYDTFIHIGLSTAKHKTLSYYDKRTSKESN